MSTIKKYTVVFIETKHCDQSATFQVVRANVVACISI